MSFLLFFHIPTSKSSSIQEVAVQANRHAQIASARAGAAAAAILPSLHPDHHHHLPVLYIQTSIMHTHAPRPRAPTAYHPIQQPAPKMPTATKPRSVLLPRGRPAQHEDPEADPGHLDPVPHKLHGPLRGPHDAVACAAALPRDEAGEPRNGVLDGEEDVRVEGAVGPAEEGAVCTCV